MMRPIIYTIIVLFAFISCTKLKFDGITERNINGEPSGSTDNTDWLLNDQFTSQENNLFNIPAINNNCTGSTASSILAFPNSCNGIFNLTNSLDTNLEAHFRIINEKNSILQSSDLINNPFIIAFDITNKVSSGEIVRVYYRFINPTTGCEFRGHGDIKIVK